MFAEECVDSFGVAILDGVDQPKVTGCEARSCEQDEDKS